MEEFLSDNQKMPLIKNYKLGNTYIEIETYEGLKKRYEYSMNLEKYIIDTMELQAEKYCKKEIPIEKNLIGRQILNIILESACTIGFGMQSIYSGEPESLNIVLFYSGITLANGSYALYRNQKLNCLKKVKLYLENKNKLVNKGININNVKKHSLHKLKKLTLNK